MRLLFVFFLNLLLLSNKSLALVVLQYHHISDKTPKATSLSPALFREHMAYLETHKFNVVSVDKLKGWLKSGQSVPQHSVVISFDDGYKSIFDEAFPELKRRGWPFVVFVNSKAHDEKNRLYMSWDELRTIAKNGATIANHTDSHPHLIRQQHYESYSKWLSRRENEISFAEQRIQTEIGKSSRIFAYPYGEYDRLLREYLKNQGYIAFGQQSGPIAQTSDPQVLPRFPMGGHYGTMDDFVLKVNSIPFPSVLIKVTDNQGKVLHNPELPSEVSKPVVRIASPMMVYSAGVNCFASGQGRIRSEVRGDALVAQAIRDLPPGRSRYNCTANAGGGRYFWHSQLFIRRMPNGQWPSE